MQRQNGPIAVYGSTGYTGRLVAAELAASGAEFVLSGRDRAKLAALSEQLEGGRVQEASLDDEESLRELLDGCAAVIACAGPFVLRGEPVLKAAVATGTHYLDTTGEQPYVRTAFEEYGPLAESAGVCVIPGMGFENVPGDMIAALTSEGIEPIDQVKLAYHAKFGVTPGSLYSTLEMIGARDVEWRDHRWMPAPRSVRRGSFEFPQPLGRQRMVRFPAGEQITVPCHVSTPAVRTTITAASFAPGPLGPLAAHMTRPARLLLRPRLRRALGSLIARLPEVPDESERDQGRFTIVCEVTRGPERRRGVIRGTNIYGLTAAAIVNGALAAARGDVPRPGALAPSQAFDPRGFLAALRRFDVVWEVEGHPDPAIGPVAKLHDRY